MKVILQRVLSANVTVADSSYKQEVVASIEQGLLLLVGYGKISQEKDNSYMANKILNLRVFPNSEDRLDKSVLDISGEILAVPQFTLYADTNKGRRPDFFKALEPGKASLLFDNFCKILKESGLKIEKGIFGADMRVNLCNWGPFTLEVGVVG